MGHAAIGNGILISALFWGFSQVPCALGALERSEKPPSAARSDSSFEANLDEVLERSMDGLLAEGLTPEQIEKETRQARAYAKAVRDRGAMGRILASLDPPRVRRRREPRGRPMRLPRAPTAKDWSKLIGLGASSQRATLRALKRWDTLAALGNYAVEAPGCGQAPTAQLLALKTEEFFPDGAAINLAMALYNKGARCLPSDAGQEKARYRLSMIAIWQDKCGEAEPHLQVLAQSPNRLFSPRALFWQRECALKAKDDKRAALLAAQLLEQHPLCFHALLVADATGANAEGLLQKGKATVNMRSGDQAIDQQVRRVELLQRVSQADAGSRILDAVIRTTPRTMTPFRLYLAVLKHREKDFLKSFTIAAEVMRDDPSSLTRGMLRLLYPQPYKDVVQANAIGAVDPLLVTALMRQESSFNANARSRAGARGLMQLLPSTLRLFSRSATRKIFQPETNVRFGSRYFHSLLEKFESKVVLALAAYNAGHGRVNQWLKRYPAEDLRLFVDLIPYTETREYVSIIERNYFWYRWMEKNGLAAADPLAKPAQAAPLRAHTLLLN